MNFELFVFLAISMIAQVAAIEKTGEQVSLSLIPLSDKNWEEYVKKHKNLLLEFYSPTCHACYEMMLTMGDVAEDLKMMDPTIPVAIVDVEANEEIATKFGISTLPSLYLMRQQYDGSGNLVFKHYFGEKSRDHIVQWVKSKMGAPSTRTNCFDLGETIAISKHAMVYFGDSEDTDLFKLHEEVAKDEDRVNFAHADIKCAEELDVTVGPEGGLVLFKTEDDVTVQYNGTSDLEILKAWVKEELKSPVYELKDEDKDLIFQPDKGLVILYAENQDKELEYWKAFERVAKGHQTNFTFVYSQRTPGIQKKFGDFFGVQGTDYPTVRVMNPAQEKYKMEKELGEQLTQKQLQRFLDDILEGKAEHLNYRRSQKAPKKNDKPVKRIVGDTWQSLVMDEVDKAVFVMIFAPWCKHCKAVKPSWEQLAVEVQGVPDLMIAKFDGDANEAKGLHFEGFPSLYYYPKGNKYEQQAYSFGKTNPPTLENLKAFLTANGHNLDGAQGEDFSHLDDLVDKERQADL